MKPAALRVIGLTGGIASGKSTVARMLTERGFDVIDADQLSRRAVEPGSRGLSRVVELFGDGVLNSDGSLDRRQLGRIVFADAALRHALEEILHPEIRRLADEELAACAAAGRRVVFYMAPLLIEAGASDRVDEIWVVTVGPQVQLQRVMERDRIERQEAERVIASQMPLAEKARCGRIVIDNNGSPEETRRRVEEILAQEIGEN